MVNVFVSHYNPKRSAQAQPNLLCQRMCLEAAEVLCGVHWNVLNGLDKHTPTREQLPDQDWLPPYRRSLSQRKHPIVLWAMDRMHYIWLLKHMRALAEEHVLRYDGKPYPAPYRDTYRWLRKHAVNVPTQYRVHPTASQLQYYGAFNERGYLKYSDDIRVQYRLSLLHKWLYLYSRKHSWGERGPPDWAFDKDLRRYLRKLYGDPTTPTAQLELRYR